MKNQEVKGSIKVKILRIVLSAEVLLTLVFVGISLFTLQKNIALSSLQAVKNIQGMYNSIQRNDTKMLSAALDIFSKNDRFKQLYQKRDRVTLYKAGAEMYRDNRERYGITHLLFIDNEGKGFLRMHKPELADDLINRPTYNQAKATGMLASGMDLGQTGIALRVAAPYSYKGKTIGFLEFGEEINNFGQIVKSEADSDILVFVNKKFLNDQAYRTARQNVKERDDWDDLKNYVLVSNTLGDREFVVSHVFDENEISALNAAAFLGTVKREGRILLKGAFPVYNAMKQPIGLVMVLSDITSQVWNARAGIAYLILAALTVLSISIWLTIRYLTLEIINPMIDLSNQAGEISMGNVGKVLETDRTDEIGLLIRSFERMRASLEMMLTMLKK